MASPNESATRLVALTACLESTRSAWDAVTDPSAPTPRKITPDEQAAWPMYAAAQAAWEAESQEAARAVAVAYLIARLVVQTLIANGKVVGLLAADLAAALALPLPEPPKTADSAPGSPPPS